jgi:small conductance mechanosensitive channel
MNLSKHPTTPMTIRQTRFDDKPHPFSPRSILRWGGAIALQAVTLYSLSTVPVSGQTPTFVPYQPPEAQKPTSNENGSGESGESASDKQGAEAAASPSQPASQETQSSGNSFLPFMGGEEQIPQTPVYLDGRKLFEIATNDSERVREIESRLKEIVRNGFEPEKLSVYNAVLNGETVICLAPDGNSDRVCKEPAIYLMTVTSTDARLNRFSADPQLLADEWSQRIERQLDRAIEERQPQHLKEQLSLAAAIALVMVLSSFTLAHERQKLEAQRQKIANQPTPPPSESSSETDLSESTPTNPVESDSLDRRHESESIGELQHKMNQREQRNINDLKQRLIQIGQVGVWGGGSYAIVGLFPYTRWLQPLVLSWLPLPLKIVGIVFSSYAGIRLTYVGIDRFFSALQDEDFLDADESRRLALRFSTFSAVFKSISFAGFVSVGTLAILSAIGLNLAPILAGAGIIGLGISLASQSLIKDAINGFLILLEDQYAVGDVIIVGDVGGLVENMNLRITQLRNGEGRLITLPNSTISVVQNLSKEWARVDCTIDVAYHTDVDRALAVLRELSVEIYSEPEWREKIIDVPEVLGIDEIDHAGILIRTWIKTKPLQHWSVGREFRRRIKTRFDREGIAIGTPQQSVTFKNSLELLKEASNGNSPSEHAIV